MVSRRKRIGRSARCLLAIVIALAISSGGFSIAFGDTSRQGERLRSLERQIERLQQELEQLRGAELGVLGEIEKLHLEVSLRQSEVARTTRRIDDLEEEIAVRDSRIAELLDAQQATRRYLEGRLIDIYKKGDAPGLRRLLGGGSADELWRGVRYASWLNERDARALAEFRQREQAVRDERRTLEARRGELEQTRRRGERERREAETVRRRRENALVTLRVDQDRRREAMAELSGAAERLAELAADADLAAVLDPGKFRGLLDWPAEGALGAGFGTIVHPKFRTEVPHPGLDIDAPEGSEFRAVFEGRVLFASWLRSYGLTVILDHGGGLASVYPHASVLQVEKGEQVLRNEVLGLVGDTGSLRGPFLYFELREGGEPVDPLEWLRERR